jgi:HRDC domain-containing protein
LAARCDAPPVPLAAWCLKCHAPSGSTELCPRCQEAVTMLSVHADAERTAQRVFEVLKAWQRKQARVQGTDGFMVIPNKALAALAAVQPEDRDALIAVPGIGPKKARDYGPVVLRYFRGLHAGKDEEPLVARAPMPEGLDEREQGLVLELREASRPLSAMAAAHGMSLDAWLAQCAALVEKGAVDLPHIYCSPAELTWIMPVLDQEPGAGREELAKRFPEASPPALTLLPALARYRRGPPA